MLRTSLATDPGDTFVGMATKTGIRVGDAVLVRFGSKRIRGEVIEDRGHLGENGVRILRVAWTPAHSDERLELEVPEGDVALARS